MHIIAYLAAANLLIKAIKTVVSRLFSLVHKDRSDVGLKRAFKEISEVFSSTKAIALPENKDAILETFKVKQFRVSTINYFFFCRKWC